MAAGPAGTRAGSPPWDTAEPLRPCAAAGARCGGKAETGRGGGRQEHTPSPADAGRPGPGGGGADRVRPLGDGRYELKALIDADWQRGLEQLRALLSHVDARITLWQLVGRIEQAPLDRHDPSRPPRRARTGKRAAEGESKPAPAAKEQPAPEPGQPSTVQDAVSPAGATPTPERTPQRHATSARSPNRQAAPRRPDAAGRKPSGVVTPTAKSPATSRANPAAVRRQVWQRDRGRCSYVDRQTGRRCSSRHLIELDHILPYAMGGAADPRDLRLLCAAQHRHRHAPHGSSRLPEP